MTQDPIGLAGNNPTLYGYVGDTNWWIDIFGLLPIPNEGIAPQHGGVNHNNMIDNIISELPSGADQMRKNQWQVDVNGDTVGRNRPDIQFNQDGVHHNIEIDTTNAGSVGHQNRIPTNDPNARNTFYRIDENGNVVEAHSQLPQDNDNSSNRGC